MHLVLQVTNRSFLILDIVIVNVQQYGMIMEPHAQVQWLHMEEQMVMQAMVYVLAQVFGN